MKVKTLKECRYKGKSIDIGTTLDIEQSTAFFWINNGYAEKNDGQQQVKPKTSVGKKNNVRST